MTLRKPDFKLVVAEEKYLPSSYYGRKRIIEWLHKGDVSILYQVYRDLLGTIRNDLQDRIEHEGWGKQFLSKRKPNGHWLDRFYQPKWISTHYLRNLNLSPDHTLVKESIQQVLNTSKADDGGIQLVPSTLQHSDVCVNGMFLNYASYFNTPEKELHSVVDSILNEIMPDGEFNCRTIRSGAKHSYLHSTISVLEGLHEFQIGGYTYRIHDMARALKSAKEIYIIDE